jgi:Domain of unknown function (DUF4145)
MVWKCSYCGQAATIQDDDRTIDASLIRPTPKIGYGLVAVRFVSLGWQSIVCPNCKNVHVELSLSSNYNYSLPESHFSGSILQKWQILPESNAKPQPDYIPAAIRQDYYEACLIRDKSPKASATLARRCLQGMIRDRWGITRKTLNQEIDALESQESGSKALINPIREYGNIGAHMEKDVNLIIDIEPEEAQLLIELLEDLFEDWYVARFNRQERERIRSEKLSASLAQKEQLRIAAPVES